ncbi:MAG: sodium:calcium antiporter [Patescibacteria group bacterium]
MIWLYYILIFISSCLLMTFSSEWLVEKVHRIALFLKLKEFVVAFFLMAFACSLPNLVVGIISALNGIPELSFADIVGGNIFDLSVVIGLTALISRKGLSVQSKTVQGSSLFTIFAAILPIFLLFDGSLSRTDGILLILTFFIYVSWLFSKKERFTKIYDHGKEELTSKKFFIDSISLILGVLLLLLGGNGIVASAQFFSQALNFPLVLIGIFIVGVGNSLPELFFSIQAAKKGQDWLLLGDLMGGVAITATLILGIVVLIHPLEINDFSLFAIARIFLIISSLFFLLFVRSNKKITPQEGFILLGIYFAFLIVEILLK